MTQSWQRWRIIYIRKYILVLVNRSVRSVWKLKFSWHSYIHTYCACLTSGSWPKDTNGNRARAHTRLLITYSCLTCGRRRRIYYTHKTDMTIIIIWLSKNGLVWWWVCAIFPTTKHGPSHEPLMMMMLGVCRAEVLLIQPHSSPFSWDSAQGFFHSGFYSLTLYLTSIWRQTTRHAVGKYGNIYKDNMQ